MKKLKFLAAVCCMAAVFAACENDTKSKIEELENRIEGLENGGNSNTGSDNATGTANGHGYVDLGLLSGLKWATCNVGATKPEEYGDYYAWGETETKSSYTSGNYSYSADPDVLPLDRDAAAVNWGGTWRMPTYAEWGELLDECTWEWKDGYKGITAGYLVTSNINGNSIFLPAAGYRRNDDLGNAGNNGGYWSSSLDYPDLAWGVNFDSDDVGRNGNYRFCGLSVRPVLGE